MKTHPTFYVGSSEAGIMIRTGPAYSPDATGVPRGGPNSSKRDSASDVVERPAA
ncbi:hypothetical protein Pcac1_g28910 [Phytophthora cactorum]|nr:hypothetical protein Pcac1_g28910 [Phytophthora cactorum]